MPSTESLSGFLHDTARSGKEAKPRSDVTSILSNSVVCTPARSVSRLFCTLQIS